MKNVFSVNTLKQKKWKFTNLIKIKQVKYCK